MVPQSFILYGHIISINLIILMVAGLISLFVFWYEMKRDGFDEERSFDLFFIAGLSAFFISRFTYGVLVGGGIKEIILHTLRFWQSGYSVPAMALGFIFTMFVFSRFWKWSIYRVTDIFSLTMCIGVALTLFGWYIVTQRIQFLIGLFFYSFLFYLLTKVRLTHRSGLVFSLFLGFNILFGLTFFRDLTYLIFYTIFLTIGLVNLYYREKRNPMGSNLPLSFLNKAKGILRAKDKSLTMEQKQLLGRDPYLSTGHENVEEYLDDVNEDIEKEVYDMRVKAITKLHQQVKKALSMMKLGKYGVCEVCGEQIDPERLKIYPEATTCIKHASK